MATTVEEFKNKLSMTKLRQALNTMQVGETYTMRNVNRKLARSVAVEKVKRNSSKQRYETTVWNEKSKTIIVVRSK